MSRSRSILLVRLLRTDEGEEPNSILNSVPLGSYRQVVELLARFNTGPDGSKKPENFGVLHGPGFLVQMPFVGPDDPVSQIVVSLTEEDIAWPVLLRVCRVLEWKMMDPQSGRAFG